MKKAELRWLLLFLLLFGVLGYLREFFFVNLNNILFIKYYNRMGSMPVPRIMEFFRQYDYATLYYSKYLFTLLWTLLFFAANFFALVKLTAHRFMIKLLIYSYLILLSVSGIAMLYNYFINDSFTGDEYTLSRWLMGVAQSPIICLILLASEKLYKSTRRQHEEGHKDL